MVGAIVRPVMPENDAEDWVYAGLFIRSLFGRCVTSFFRSRSRMVIRCERELSMIITEKSQIRVLTARFRSDWCCVRVSGTWS